MTPNITIQCWEPTFADHAVLPRAQMLYERALDADERIPWAWIERSVIESEPADGAWRKHLILARAGDDLAGLTYGAYLPGFGGYLCYVAVDDRFRQHGVATQLYREFFHAMRREAAALDEPLPFVLWESCRPDADEGAAALKLWQARLRLFERVGGFWIEGLELPSPNFADLSSAPVPLQVFLAPMDEAKESFDAARLRQVAVELLDRVYDCQPGDPDFEAFRVGEAFPKLVSPLGAGHELLATGS